MLLAMQNQLYIVHNYLAKVVALGRIIIPLEPGMYSLDIHIIWFEVFPKPHQPRRWKLIVDLSHNKANSVNDGLEPQLCSLTYASIDDAVTTVLRIGKSSYYISQVSLGEHVLDSSGTPL